MVRGARSGLKPPGRGDVESQGSRLNGQGSPVGFETEIENAKKKRSARLNGQGSPVGFPAKIRGWEKGRNKAHGSNPVASRWEQASGMESRANLGLHLLLFF